eukprot:scaffold10576_cov115-Isochrysis_galbana.AAC.8
MALSAAASAKVTKSRFVFPLSVSFPTIPLSPPCSAPIPLYLCLPLFHMNTIAVKTNDGRAPRGGWDARRQCARAPASLKRCAKSSKFSRRAAVASRAAVSTSGFRARASGSGSVTGHGVMAAPPSTRPKWGAAGCWVAATPAAIGDGTATGHQFRFGGGGYLK